MQKRNRMRKMQRVVVTQAWRKVLLILVTNNLEELRQTIVQYLRCSTIKAEKSSLCDEKFSNLLKRFNNLNIILTLDRRLHICTNPNISLPTVTQRILVLPTEWSRTSPMGSAQVYKCSGDSATGLTGS